MAHPIAPAAPAIAPISVKAILPWAVFFGILLMAVLYFIGAEQGATSLISGEDVHEWVHDGRHLLGFPCH
ncbi:CbtB-domain containing protein [Kitasatospora sp. NPDC051170]|uniref:CbtB domain-containing protein n=1 Tax=Streptomycetaceae TaxID=2062 RepID=UPI0004C94122|nr:CbtB-domain containing protein [Streptomyces sp. NRRL WC-3742]